MFLTSLPRRTRQHGFTLIELMMIVTLLGVLIAIAMPSYSKYRDRTRTYKAVLDIGAMSLQIEMYARDNRANPATLAEVGLGALLDPWGRPYVYYDIAGNNQGAARKDRRLSPINSDFDLYSVGPDGVTHKQVSNQDSLDDIIRGSSGKFVGIAADF